MTNKSPLEDYTKSTKGTTKSNGKKEKNDKFYTNPEIAKLCLSILNLDEYEIKIEPSAGAGSFSNLVNNCIAYDIAPEGDGIIEQNWLEYSQNRDETTKVLVFGNPPFGVQNNLAVKFINHSATFADTIAFILPRSFRKASVTDRLNENLFLREEIILPRNSFLLEGIPYDLPAVFQIWDYNKDRVRKKTVKESPNEFKFVKKDENPDFSLQRVGGKAGTASIRWEEKNSQSNNFISVNNKSLVSSLVESINNYSFTSREDSVGPRSISKSEFIPIINKMIADLKMEN